MSLALSGTALSPQPAGRATESLDEAQCTAMAAQASSLGNLLDEKARTCCRTVPGPNQKTPHGFEPPRLVLADLRVDVLRTAALEARNQAAGQGLEAFYRLEQATAQHEIAVASLETLDRVIRERDVLDKQELPVPSELRELSDQQIEARARTQELETAIQQISVELRHLLRITPERATTPIQPLATVRFEARVIDPEAEVSLGLARRPEVSLLYRLDSPQTEDSLRSLRSSLAVLNPLLAMDCEATVMPPHPLLARLSSPAAAGSSPAELASLRTLWETYRSERMRTIAHEIRSAAIAIQGAQDQVGMAGHRVEYWQGELDRIASKKAEDLNTFAAETRARLEFQKAQATLWQRVVEWQIAVAKLRQAQFLLL